MSAVILTGGSGGDLFLASRAGSKTAGAVLVSGETGTTGLCGDLIISSYKGTYEGYRGILLRTVNSDISCVSGSVTIRDRYASACSSGITILSTVSSVSSTVGSITVSVGYGFIGVGGYLTVSAGSTTSSSGGSGGAISMAAG